MRSQAYDLVLNGWELGSGSVRIHRRDIQQQIFSLLGITEAEAQSRFGFLLDAFRYGAPPHAGFAFGIDRLVAVARGRGEHPRGHRVPEDPVGRRPAHRRARPRSSRRSSASSGSTSRPAQSRSAGRGRLRLGRGGQTAIRSRGPSRRIKTPGSRY